MPNPLAFGILGLDQIKPTRKRQQQPLQVQPLESNTQHDNLTPKQHEAVNRLRANGAKGSTVFVASSRRSKRKQSNPQSTKA